ncbi:MAG: acetyl-CoA C-acyltransferase [Candidatus Sericytochromatia bacterium]
MAARQLMGRKVVVVAGARTPFLRSGTGFSQMMSYELGAMAVSGLLHKTEIDPALVDRVIMGTVIAEPRTSNLAREVVLASGLPQSCPAYTVTAACTSANVAITNAIEAIAVGMADVVIAGGAETLSDVPIRFSKPVRQRLIAAQKAKGAADYVKLLSGLKPTDIMPDTPAIAEFTTGLTMGENAERMAKRYGVSREEQDAYALDSHLWAAKATEEGLLREQIVTAMAPPDFQPISADNGVRGDTTLEKLGKLPPVFDRRFGTVTAGNASFLTDGAAVCLLMSEEAAERLGFEPLAVVKSFSFVSMDPLEELLLGPAFSIPGALDSAGLTMDQVDVFELHEAFAAQMVTNIKVLGDETFCRDRLGREGAVGRIPREKLNAWGGSLSIGHPFGATGARLVMTAAQRLKHEQGRYGLVAACAAGALGSAMVLERV